MGARGEAREGVGVEVRMVRVEERVEERGEVRVEVRVMRVGGGGGRGAGCAPSGRKPMLSGLRSRWRSLKPGSAYVISSK